MLNASSKAVYDTGDDNHDSGFGLENQIGMQKRKGQHRGADGKFESSMKDVDDLDLEPGFGKSFDQSRGPKGGQKVNKKMSMQGGAMGGRKGGDPFETGTKKRKGRGAGGHVANVFYDSQLPGSQPMVLAHADSMGGGMDSELYS